MAEITQIGIKVTLDDKEAKTGLTNIVNQVQTLEKANISLSKATKTATASQREETEAVKQGTKAKKEANKVREQSGVSIRKVGDVAIKMANAELRLMQDQLKASVSLEKQRRVALDKIAKVQAERAAQNQKLIAQAIRGEEDLVKTIERNTGVTSRANARAAATRAAYAQETQKVTAAEAAAAQKQINAQLGVQAQTKRTHDETRKLEMAYAALFARQERTSASTTKLATAKGEAARNAQHLNTNLSNTTLSMAQFLGVTNRTNATLGILVNNISYMVAGTFAMRGIVGATNSFATFNSQIEIATRSVEEFTEVQQGLVDVAMENRVALLPLTKLYSSMGRSIEQLGGTTQDSLHVIDLYSKALQLTAPTATEASAATLQFTQAMGSGVLRGEEFNSIMENGRGVAMVLADALGVNVGQLREMAHQGQLTSEVVINALTSQADRIERDFQKIPLTITASLEKLRSGGMLLVGTLDSVVGSSQKVANVLSAVGDAMAKVGTDFKTIATVLSVTLTPAFLAYAAAVGTATAANIAFVASLKAVVAASRAFLATPLGMAVTGLVVGVTALYYAFDSLKQVIDPEPLTTYSKKVSDLQAEISGLNELLGESEKETSKWMDSLASSSLDVFSIAVSRIKFELTAVAIAATSLGKHFISLLEVVGKAAVLDFSAAAQAIEDMALTQDLANAHLELARQLHIEYADAVRNGTIGLKTQAEMLAEQEREFNESNTAVKKATDSEYDFAAALSAVTFEYQKMFMAANDVAKMEAYLAAIRKGATVDQAQQLADLVELNAETKERIALQRLEAGYAENLRENLAQREFDVFNAQLEKEQAIYIADLEARVTFAENLRQNLANREFEIFDRQLQKEYDAYIRNLENQERARREQADAAIAAVDAEIDAVYRLSNARAELFRQNEINARFAEDSRAFDQADALANQVDNLTLSVGSLGDSWMKTGDAATQSLASMIDTLENYDKQHKKSAEDQQKIDNLRLKNRRMFSEDSIEFKINEEKIDAKQADLNAKRSENEKNMMFALMASTVQAYGRGSAAAKAYELVVQSLAVKDAIGAVIKAWNSAPFPANLVAVASTSAATAALLSQMGQSLGVGGGGGTGLAQTGIQLTEGGRFDGEQSQSVSNVTDMMLDLEVDQYRELRGINTGVKDLKDAITGTVRGLFMGGDIANLSGNAINTVTPSAIGGAIDNLVESVPLIGGALAGIGSAIFGSTSRKTTDFGLTAAGALGNLAVAGFEDIETKRSNLFGSRTSRSTQARTISAEAQNSIGLVFQSLADTMSEVGDQLDRDISNELASFQFNLGKVSLQGSPAEVTERLQNALSTQADRLANAMFADIVGAYQRVDEGLFETAVRVAVERGITQNVLEMTGQRLVGDAIAVSQALVNIAGGMSELRDAAENYYDKFFDDEEKALRNQQLLTDALSDMNLVLPSTREGFRNLVESLDLTTDWGRRTYVALTEAADAADEYYKTVEEGVDNLRDSVRKAFEAFSGQVTSIREGLLALIGDEAVLAYQRQQTLKATDPLLKAQQKQLWLLQDVAQAQNTYNNGIAQAQSFLSASFKTIRNFTAGLMMTTAAVTGQAFSSQIDLARGGDRDALSGITSTAQTFLTQSRSGASTLEEYLRIQSGVMLDLLSLEEQLTPEEFLADEIRDALDDHLRGVVEALNLVHVVDAEVHKAINTKFKELGTEVLTYAQVREALTGVTTSKDIARLIAKADTNNDGLVSAIEMNAMRVSSLAQSIGRTLQPMFNMIDTSLDGVIDYEEFKKTFENVADEETLGMVYDALAGNSGVIESVSGVEETTDPLALAAQSQLDALDSIWDNTYAQVDATLTLNNTMLDLATALRQLHGLEQAKATQSRIEESQNVLGGLSAQRSSVIQAREQAEATSTSRISATSSAFGTLINEASIAYKKSSDRRASQARTDSARSSFEGLVRSMRGQLQDPQTAKSAYEFLVGMQSQMQSQYNSMASISYNASENRWMQSKFLSATGNALNVLRETVSFGQQVGAPTANPSASSYARELAEIANQMSNEQAELNELFKLLEQQELMALTGVDGSHRTGLGYVPFDGYRAELHEGEMVVPKAESDFLRMGGIVIELQQLRQEVTQLRQQSARSDFELIKSSKDMRDTLDQWNFDGLPAERT